MTYGVGGAAHGASCQTQAGHVTEVCHLLTRQQETLPGRLVVLNGSSPGSCELKMWGGWNVGVYVYLAYGFVKGRLQQMRGCNVGKI